MADQINQEDLKEFYNKGILAFEKKNYDYAIELFSQILLSKYDHLEARKYLHLSLKHRSGEASPSFISNIIGYINRFIGILSAEGLLKKDNVSGALEKYEKILLLNPGDIEALKKIAALFYKKGLIPHAIQNLQEAKSINQNDITVLKKLGEIYLRKEDYPNAKANYELALKINSTDREVLKSLKNLDALGTIKKQFSD